MKKLKRLPSGLSYNEVREKQKERERAEDDALPTSNVVNIERPRSQDEADTDPKTEAEGSADAPSASAEPVSSDVAAEPVPSVEEQDTSEERPERVNSTSQQSPAKVGTDADEKPKVDRSETAPASGSPDTNPAKIRLKGTVARPALGVSKIYDDVADRYGEDVAMANLLDAAIQALNETLEAGDTIAMQGEPVYACHGKKLQMKRSLPPVAYDTVRQQVDPLNVLKPGKIGTTIMQSALNRYIESDQKSSKPKSTRS